MDEQTMSVSPAHQYDNGGGTYHAATILYNQRSEGIVPGYGNAVAGLSSITI